MRWLRFAPALLLAACAGNGGSIDGSVHGRSLSISATASAAVMSTAGGQSSGTAVIALSSDGSLCSDAGQGVLRKNESGILITLTDVAADNTTSTPSAPGDYTIYVQNGPPPPRSAVLLVSVLDGSCQDVPNDEARAMSGSVKLDAVSGDVFSGSFDVQLDSGDHLTGSFDPQPCPALQQLMTTDVPSCK